jgi:hypothetical protein
MKKVTCAIVAALALLLGSALPGYAWDHSGWHHGSRARAFVGARVFVGPRLWWGSPWWWGPVYPYYVAPPVVVQQEPPVYLQQPESQPQQPNYWYYCQNPQGYYPYVQQCPGGWMTVVPPTTPPSR